MALNTEIPPEGMNTAKRWGSKGESQNLFTQTGSISRAERERLNRHRGLVIWFTGLSGAGKSTLANALESELHRQGRHTYILDGDNIRQGLNRDLGFTVEDRVENIRRIAEVSALMLDAGMVVMVAFISPFQHDRELARQRIGAERFFEVFVDAPLSVCEARDPKGLYRRAHAGSLPNMTGIDSAYEVPDHPRLHLDTSHSTVSQSLAELCAALDGLLSLPEAGPDLAPAA